MNVAAKEKGNIIYVQIRGIFPLFNPSEERNFLNSNVYHVLILPRCSISSFILNDKVFGGGKIVALVMPVWNFYRNYLENKF